jgi:hypothetical protein
MSLNHITGLADVDLNVKSLSIQGVPVGNSGLSYYQPSDTPSAVPFSVNAGVMTDQSLGLGSNVWNPTVGDLIEVSFSSQVSSTNPSNTLDCSINYGTDVLAGTSFNLLNLPGTLNPGGGYTGKAVIYCKQKQDNTTFYTYTFCTSFTIEASGSNGILSYFYEQQFNKNEAEDQIKLEISAPFAGEILVNSILMKQIK